jgi:hypothetical protein
MAIFMLQSLVPSGSVRMGALGYLRLEGSVQANGKVPGGVVSRRPLPGNPPVADATKGRCPGAGRSRRHAGFPTCWPAATPTATPTWQGSAAAGVAGIEERSR